MGVVFKPHRLLGDDFHLGQAGRQDPTEYIFNSKTARKWHFLPRFFFKNFFRNQNLQIL
jgi:hypothetical protein